MQIYVNPVRLLKIAPPLPAWLGWIGLALIAIALASGPLLAAGDYLQRDRDSSNSVNGVGPPWAAPREKAKS